MTDILYFGSSVHILLFFGKPVMGKKKSLMSINELRAVKNGLFLKKFLPRNYESGFKI